MLNKSEKLIIVGKSGSGKDYLLRQLDNKLKPSVKVTTRPQRSSEVEGVTYHFKDNKEFDLLSEKSQFIVKQEFFNDKGDLWKYGILKEDFNNSQVFIMTPGEVSQIDEESRLNCFIVYLDINRETRESRILNRGDNNDSILRRIEADELDFQNFDNYDLKITDPLFDAESILNLMS